MKKALLLMLFAMVLVTGCKKDEENSGEEFVIYKTLDEVKQAGEEFVLYVKSEIYSEFILNGTKINMRGTYVYVAVEKGKKYRFKHKTVYNNICDEWFFPGTFPLYRMKHDSYKMGVRGNYSHLYIVDAEYTNYKLSEECKEGVGKGRRYVTEGEGYFTITGNDEVF
ncbi:hypothetical protein CAPN008_21920 [Capnocytophaga canis]|uniref:hypothetical protein n=1 Tax=Capnocytophaga canis TaxID=1848903 RepID=UPI001AC63339|nr:hypothetical protein [Capnocytophaga canis]GIM62142.1 hypothetical protein CAPN008_21920 [Capnocytophaga canis]